MLVNALESCAGKVEMRKGNTTDKNAVFYKINITCTCISIHVSV